MDRGSAVAVTGIAGAVPVPFVPFAGPLACDTGAGVIAGRVCAPATAPMPHTASTPTARRITTLHTSEEKETAGRHRAVRCCCCITQPLHEFRRGNMQPSCNGRPHSDAGEHRNDCYRMAPAGRNFSSGKFFRVADHRWPFLESKEFASASSAMSEAAVLNRTVPARTARTIPRSLAIPGALLLVLVAVLYAGVGAKLVYDWYDLPDFSHGFIVPFFSAFLIWERRKQIVSTPLAPSWAGLPLVAFSLLMLLTGRFGADLFLSRLSFLLLTAGTVWAVAGGRMLRVLAFPIGVLLLAIPLPAVVFNQLTFPLQILASRVASAMLPLAGVPVLRDGNVINLPAMQLEVAEACSGIRSMMSLFTVAVFFGYLFERGTLRRILLALCSLPIAVAANALRIFGTGLCVQYWDPDKAMGFFHEFSGWLMFLVSLSCLYLIHVATRRIGRRNDKVPEAA